VVVVVVVVNAVVTTKRCRHFVAHTFSSLMRSPLRRPSSAYSYTLVYGALIYINKYTIIYCIFIYIYICVCVYTCTYMYVYITYIYICT
jgi:TRAP-type C4-dicarboxylate transport system permease small subunit